jgi:vitamin B12 transporter
MTFIKLPHILQTTVVTLGLILGVALPCAHAEEAEDTSALFIAWQEQSSSSATRTPKPLSQTAENTTVITARDIEALNAHTLGDVLATVTGIQVHQLGGPGSLTYTYIQSNSAFNVQVFLDGAPLNNAENFADVSAVPARIIERIEIVKGVASSSWGRALGGVINVITKSPAKTPVSGTVSASIGERTTADTGAEMSGSSGRAGYYLSGGYLGSNGLSPLPQRSLDSNYAYAKLTYDLPGEGNVWGTFNYSRLSRMDNYSTDWDFKEESDQDYLYSTFGVKRPLTEQLEVELNAHYIKRDKRDHSRGLIDTTYEDFFKARDRVGGVGVKLQWRGEHQLLVGGFEYEHETFNSTDLLDGSSLYARKLDRYGFYLNDTITVGPL